jgi:hypothetical protein
VLDAALVLVSECIRLHGFSSTIRRTNSNVVQAAHGLRKAREIFLNQVDLEFGNCEQEF